MFGSGTVQYLNRPARPGPVDVRDRRSPRKYEHHGSMPVWPSTVVVRH